MSAGRDLEIRIITRDEVDTSAAARQLDTLADHTGAAADQLGDLESSAGSADKALSQLDAGSAGSDLRDLGDDADSAGSSLSDLEGDAKRADRSLKGIQSDKASRDLKELGEAAKEAGRKGARGLDDLADGARKSFRAIDDDAGKAAKGLDDFKDEAASSGKESAASFTGGFDDITDTVQEIAANAFGGFGPVGAAAGLAAAAGIGILTAELTETNERIKDIRDNLTDIGLDDATTDLDRYTAALEALKENDDLTQLRTSVEMAGVAWTDYIDALVNGGPQVDVIKGKLHDLGDDAGGLAGIWDDNVQGAQAAFSALDNGRQAAQGATTDIDAIKTATAGLTEQQLVSAEVVDDFTSAIESFTDPAEVYKSLLKGMQDAEKEKATATAKATKSEKDDWTDYAKQVDVSVAQYISALERQVSAQENWATNLGKLARRGVSEGVLAELERMGPEGAPLVAKLTTATEAELTKLNGVMARKSDAATTKLEEGLRAGAGKAARGAGALREEVRQTIEDKRALRIPVTVADTPFQAVYDLVAGVQAAIRPVIVPVMLQNVPRSIYAPGG